MSVDTDILSMFFEIFDPATLEGIMCASPSKSRGRPPTQRLTNLDARLIEIVKSNKPCTVRGVFYQAEVMGLVEKTEASVTLIQRRLLKLRRRGAIPYSSIVDETSSVYGHPSYDGISDLAGDVARLYRKDYWRNSDVWVQIWIEKRALMGVLGPIVADKWRLNLYPCGGQPSETMLWRGGQDIISQNVETHVYVLSDFDPAGDTIFTTLSRGTKGVAAGLSRFCGSVPIQVHKLALSEEQVRDWKLPTRPAKKEDGRAKQFIERHGDISAELDAIPRPCFAS
jgi:hypothetical protein